MDTSSSTAVQRITVEQLFGRYTYTIEPFGVTPLLILYGDNGSGKTTILKLLYHLLSALHNLDHLTFAANIPFSCFEVCLSNGVRIFAKRSHPTDGSFIYGATQDQNLVFEVTLPFDDRGILTPRTRKDITPLVSGLVELVPSDIYYIGDDRRLVSDRIPSRRTQDNTQHSTFVSYLSPRIHHRRLSGRLPFTEQGNTDLSSAIEEASKWVSSNAIRATNVGTDTTNQIFARLIKGLAVQSNSAVESQRLTNKLLAKLDELEARNNDCEPFGLSSSFSGRELAQTLSSANSSSRQLMTEILQPYLESVEARLDAVSSLQSTLYTFVSWVNRFLKDKAVRVSLDQGIEILTDDDQLLSPEQLSSGEQHLLLLLTSTLYAQDRASLFVIDEPELSLNMKWQRQLPDALLECTSSGLTQFVLATHSFEILSQHRQEVVTLTGAA